MEKQQYIDARNTEVVDVVEDSISNPIDFLVLDEQNKFRKVSKDSIVEPSELSEVAFSGSYDDLDNKPKPLTNEDWTLIIDENNVIWSNITGHTEYFKANGTDRNFVADFDFATIEVVYVNGVAIERNDYLILSENEIEIKENITLLNNTPVAIQGSIFIVEPTI